MDIKKLNEIFGDLENFRSSNNEVKRIVEHEINNSYGEGAQGEEGIAFEIFEVNGLDGYFVKLEIRTDSYGYDERVRGATLVKPIEKKVTVYEFED